MRTLAILIISLFQQHVLFLTTTTTLALSLTKRDNPPKNTKGDPNPPATGLWDSLTSQNLPDLAKSKIKGVPTETYHIIARSLKNKEDKAERIEDEKRKIYQDAIDKQNQIKLDNIQISTNARNDAALANDDVNRAEDRKKVAVSQYIIANEQAGLSVKNKDKLLKETETDLNKKTVRNARNLVEKAIAQTEESIEESKREEAEGIAQVNSQRAKKITEELNKANGLVTG